MTTRTPSLAAPTREELDARPCGCTMRHAHRRPLCVVEIYGGLAQAEWSWSGTGVPVLEVLDFDREGASDDELREFADRVDGVIALMEARGEPDEGIDTHDDSIRRVLDAYRETVAGWRAATPADA